MEARPFWRYFMNQKEKRTASFDELLIGLLLFLKKEKSYQPLTLQLQ